MVFQAKAYFYNQALNQGIPASPDFNYFVLLESFCMADHGRALAYEIKNEKSCPDIGPKKQSTLQMKDGKTSSERKSFPTAVAYSKSEAAKCRHRC